MTKVASLLSLVLVVFLMLTATKFRLFNNRKHHSTLQHIAVANQFIEAFKADNKKCPSDFKEVQVYLVAHGLKNVDLFNDDWGREFRLEKSNCRAYSLGENGRDERALGDDLILR